MHDFVSGYRDYKVLMGGVSIGVMLVMGYQLVRRWESVPAEERGAYQLYGIYIAGAIILLGVLMAGYISGVR